MRVEWIRISHPDEISAKKDFTPMK